MKIQNSTPPGLQTPGWDLVKDNRNILRCSGRIPGYNSVYVEGGLFDEKLIAHAHEQIMHLGVANTMAHVRIEWWIPKLRSKVKKVINRCKTCKVFSTKSFGSTTTAELPNFRTEDRRPFETTRVDSAGPLECKITKKERGKCYVMLFTCVTSRAVHLEVTKSQTAEEFHIERPLSLVCPLEIKGPVATEDGTLQLMPGIQQPDRCRNRRRAAETAKERIRLIATDEDDD